MKNTSIPVEVPSKLYFELSYRLRKAGDLRAVDDIVAIAINSWLRGQLGEREGRGYQWGDLFLPDGCQLRIVYLGHNHYAKVEGDALMYHDDETTPARWARDVTGSVRNPWRDVWIRRNPSEGWTQAKAWRQGARHRRILPFEERRTAMRRASDL